MIVEEKIEKGYPESKFSKLRRKLKRLFNKKKKETLTFRGHGELKIIWNQEELPEIIRAICKKYKNITYISINKTEISWNYEERAEELFGRKKIKKNNPSRRET